MKSNLPPPDNTLYYFTPEGMDVALKKFSKELSKTQNETKINTVELKDETIFGKLIGQPSKFDTSKRFRMNWTKSNSTVTKGANYAIDTKKIYSEEPKTYKNGASTKIEETFVNSASEHHHLYNYSTEEIKEKAYRW